MTFESEKRELARGTVTNPVVAQAFEPAGGRDFPVPSTALENAVNPQPGKAALRQLPFSG